METARLPKITELTGEGNHMTRHVKNLWKFSSLYGCLFILMAFLIGMNAYGQVIPAQVTQEEAIDEMKVPVLLEESEVPSSRDRFNIPYPKPEMTLKSGNFTDNSAIDVRGSPISFTSWRVWLTTLITSVLLIILSGLLHHTKEPRCFSWPVR